MNFVVTAKKKGEKSENWKFKKGKFVLNFYHYKQELGNHE